MSGICSTCKHMVYCSYRSTAGGARECDEHEGLESAPAFDWDLKRLFDTTPPAQADTGSDDRSP